VLKLTYFIVFVPFLSFNQTTSMGVIILLIIAGVLVAGGFLIAFFWAVRSGQFDDTYSPSVRILFDDKPKDQDDQTEN
jgi:cbb3-type cytochrome oxidase maturation protein